MGTSPTLRYPEPARQGPDAGGVRHAGGEAGPPARHNPLLGLSFFAMALNRLILAMLSASSPGGVRGSWHDRMYWVRLVAFLLILLAILDKNRAPRPSPPRPR